MRSSSGSLPDSICSTIFSSRSIAPSKLSSASRGFGLLLMGKTEELSTARRGEKGDLLVKFQGGSAPTYPLFLEYRQLTFASIWKCGEYFRLQIMKKMPALSVPWWRRAREMNRGEPPRIRQPTSDGSARLRDALRIDALASASSDRRVWRIYWNVLSLYFES